MADTSPGAGGPGTPLPDFELPWRHEPGSLPVDVCGVLGPVIRWDEFGGRGICTIHWLLWLTDKTWREVWQTHDAEDKVPLTPPSRELWRDARSLGDPEALLWIIQHGVQLPWTLGMLLWVDQQRRRRPSRPLHVPDSGPVVLYDKEGNCREKHNVTDLERAALKALESAFPDTLTDVKLREQCKGDPVRLLKRLRERDPDFGAALTRPTEGLLGRPRAGLRGEFGLTRLKRFP
jgi:hypothetical protein